MKRSVKLYIIIGVCLMVVLISNILLASVNNNPCFMARTKVAGVNNCYIKAAMRNNDENYCKILEGKYAGLGFENLMESCYRQLAAMNKDYSYCDKLTGSGMDVAKELCYTAVASIKDDQEVCGKLTDGDSCYLHLSIIKKDPKLCGFIKYQDHKKECFWRHENAKNSFGEKRLSCDLLFNQKDKDLCYQSDIYKTK